MSPFQAIACRLRRILLASARSSSMLTSRRSPSTQCWSDTAGGATRPASLPDFAVTRPHSLECGWRLVTSVWSAVAWHYIWPALREHPSPENLKPILLLHGFRFLGLAFVVPGVVSPELPAAFAQPVAYGDLISAILALLALATLG